MPWISTPAYSLMVRAMSCIAIACGLTGSPYIYVTEKVIPKEKEKKKKSFTLAKADSGENDLSLVSVNNIEQLVKGTKSKLNFKELGMKWGGQVLSENDILFSPCQNGIYYLMKHHGRSGYKLDNGTPISIPPGCRETHKYQHLKHVKLSWAKQTMGSITLSQITVGSCSLSNIGRQRAGSQPKLQLNCRPYLLPGEDVRGNYGLESYEYE